MPRSSKTRRLRLPGAGRQPPSDVRTSEVVLAVMVVALLGALCLFLLASLVGAENLASVPIPAGDS